MDIPQLAAETMKSLEPFLPYLVEGGKIAAKAALETVGKKFSEAAWQKAEALWGQVKPGVEAAPDAEKALKYYLEHPGDEDAYPALRLQVKKLLLENPSLAANLGQVINASGGSIGIGGNVSGNVLNQSNGNTVIQAEHYHAAPQPAPAISAEQLQKDYLRILSSQCKKLPLGAIHPNMEEAERKLMISLEDVYIDLEVLPPARSERQMERGEEARRVSLPLALQEKKLRRVVVTGDAGAGKSTFVNYMLIALAAPYLNEAAKKPLPAGSTLAGMFPVRILLREAAAQIPAGAKTADVNFLWNALRSDILKKFQCDDAETLFARLKHLIETQPCLIMLDGLDEVSDAENRLGLLREAIENFAAPLTQSVVIVTVRPYAYERQAQKLSGFEELALQPLSKEQIAAFISDFYQSLKLLNNWDDHEVKTRAGRLAAAIGERDYLQELAEKPLLLALIASVDSSESELPDSRARLYEQAVKLLLLRWQKRKEESSAEESKLVKFFSNRQDDVLRILQRLAYEVHERQRRESRAETGRIPSADISANEVSGAFHRALPDSDTEELIDFLRDRTGLLLDRGGVYVFPHRSFQEYLAAAHLAGQDEPAKKLLEEAKRAMDWWREAILLSVGKMKANGFLGTAAGVLNEFVPREVEKVKEEISPLQWRLAALAGQAAAEIKLHESVEESHQALLERIAGWLAALVERGALEPKERAEAGDTLARLSDPRPGVINDFLFCHIPAGRFMMGSKDGEGDSDEHPQFPHEIKQEFYMTRYPITNAQFDRFVKADGYKTEAYWQAAKQAGYWNADGFKGALDAERRTAPIAYGAPFNLPNHPAVGVSWYEAAAFCQWLTAQMRDTSDKLLIYNPATHRIQLDENLQSSIVNRKLEIRLPTEAEWEYAARAGTQTPYSWGDNITPNHANYNETGIGATSAVGLFPAGMNPLGLLDMSGNVWEWCATAWQENYKDYLKNEKKLNQPEGDVARVLRGGSFGYIGRSVRCACRYWFDPYYRDYYIGFRVVVCAVVSHFS
ncbi:MAG: SUMF1/EgtB/PvdO family nonheme iron enzyme [Chloroflexota bacterium]